MNTIQYYKETVFKNTTEIERYFTTVKQAIEYFELVKSNLIEDLNQVKKQIDENSIFNVSLRWKVGTNNAKISQMFKDFENSLVTEIENQIQDAQNKIEALETFL